MNLTNFKVIDGVIIACDVQIEFDTKIIFFFRLYGKEWPELENVMKAFNIYHYECLAVYDEGEDTVVTIKRKELA